MTLRIARGVSRRNFAAAMNSSAPTSAPSVLFRKAGLREATILLALAWVLPFAIHLVPWTGDRPLGAYLLPGFWTALVAVYFYGAWMGLAVGLFAPVLNLAITGQPESVYFWKTAAELILFALVAAGAVRRLPRLAIMAPLAYIVAKTAAAGLLTPEMLNGRAGTPGGFLAHLFEGSLPGLVVLAALNAALVWSYPKTKTGGGEA